MTDYGICAADLFDSFKSSHFNSEHSEAHSADQKCFLKVFLILEFYMLQVDFQVPTKNHYECKQLICYLPKFTFDLTFFSFFFFFN